MLALISFSTGENWNLIMFELANQDDFNGKQCVYNQTYEDIARDGILGCGTFFSYIFFISFTILISMFIMNLSVAAVIEGLNKA